MGIYNMNDSSPLSLSEIFKNYSSHLEDEHENIDNDIDDFQIQQYGINSHIDGFQTQQGTKFKKNAGNVEISFTCDTNYILDRYKNHPNRINNGQDLVTLL